MSEQYLGEIRVFTGDYAPQDWAMCNGQLLQISQYNALFSLIGTTYGGDGRTTFALPDLRSRVGVHMGTGSTGTVYALAARSGAETVTVLESNLPAHTHIVTASDLAGTTAVSNNAVWANSPTAIYSKLAPNAEMAPAAITSAGGNQAHGNIMPYCVLTYIIALIGNYPQRPN